jgi:hypothetical protein
LEWRKWGKYTSPGHTCAVIEKERNVVGNSSKARILLKVMWMDIDYMDGYKDFTLDPVSFPEEKLGHLWTICTPTAKSMYEYLFTLPIININSNYTTHQCGLELDVYEKTVALESAPPSSLSSSWSPIK